jgi:hypothetical protein
VSDAIADLGARLTDPKDREAYAELISYTDSLPPADEFRRLVQLMGLHSLLVQRVPDAVGELLAELKSLPERVAFGATEMTRKATDGFAEASHAIETAATEIRRLSEGVDVSLNCWAENSVAITGTMLGELARLETAAAQMARINAKLIIREKQSGRLCRVLVLLVVFLAGTVAGLAFACRTRPLAGERQSSFARATFIPGWALGITK